MWEDGRLIKNKRVQSAKNHPGTRAQPRPDSFIGNDSIDTQASLRLDFPRRPHTSECKHVVSLARLSAYAAKVFVERPRSYEK